ncbi:MAG: hypothetical protein IT299_12970 [Dehalococcoidia bacterium]|nr:hypothetical protein [Dehalococcoidia bacterium]
MVDIPTFAEGHEHSEECGALYAEWRRHHVVVMDVRGRFSRQDILAARREREKFEHQLRLIGCSGEALRRIEKDAEVALYGHPLM